MYRKIFIEVTKTSPHESTNENALQLLNRTVTTNIIRRCFVSSKQTSQRQSPMYCKIFIGVTETSPHQSTNENALQLLNRTVTTNIIRRCFASSKKTSQRQSPMYCKILTDVTKTIADVLQDLYRSHKDITTLVYQQNAL